MPARRPQVEGLIAYAKEQGAATIGVVGCCWGGWAAFHTSAICADVACGVIFHPSCQLEGMFGGSVDELCASAPGGARRNPSPRISPSAARVRNRALASSVLPAGLPKAHGYGRKAQLCIY